MKAGRLEKVLENLKNVEEIQTPEVIFLVDFPFTSDTMFLTPHYVSRIFAPKEEAETIRMYIQELQKDGEIRDPISVKFSDANNLLENSVKRVIRTEQIHSSVHYDPRLESSERVHYDDFVLDLLANQGYSLGVFCINRKNPMMAIGTPALQDHEEIGAIVTMFREGMDTADRKNVFVEKSEYDTLAGYKAFKKEFKRRRLRSR